MYRLLSPVRLLVIHTSRRRGLGSPLPPPLFLGFSHSQSRVPVGLGRCRSSAPASFWR
jgi:hypothetical protein